MEERGHCDMRTDRIGLDTKVCFVGSGEMLKEAGSTEPGREDRPRSCVATRDRTFSGMQGVLYLQ